MEVIEGTLANPFGDSGLTPQMIFDGNASARLTLFLSPLEIGSFVMDIFVDEECLSYNAFSAFFAHEYDTHINVFMSTWVNDNLTDATRVEVYGEDATVTGIIDYGDVLQTTLTIIWHPLPN